MKAVDFLDTVRGFDSDRLSRHADLGGDLKMVLLLANKRVFLRGNVKPFVCVHTVARNDPENRGVSIYIEGEREVEREGGREGGRMGERERERGRG